MKLALAKEFLARPEQPIKTVDAVERIGMGRGYGLKFERTVSTVKEWPEKEQTWLEALLVAAWIVFGLGGLWLMSVIRS